MRLFLILFLLCTASGVHAQRELTTITVNYATPGQLVAVIEPYLSDGSSVSVYQNRLILNVTPQELAKTHELLQQLDSPGRQLLISVRTDSSGSNSRQGVDVNGVIRSGDTVITTGPGGRKTETHTTVRVENSSATQSGGGNQAVRVTEGLPAYIATGMTAPVQSYTVGTDGRRYYQQDYVSAVAGFYATTWLNDKTVRISIDQSNDQFKGQAIATQQLQSEVSGRLGEWLPIGVLNNTSSQQDSGIASRSNADHTSSTALFIKVEVLE